MNEQIRIYLEKYSESVTEIFTGLRQLIYESISAVPEETMWAKLPSYYVGEKFVRLIPFKDHINVEATAINQYKDELNGYKITPKGMLQLYADDDIPKDVLQKVFYETLN